MKLSEGGPWRKIAVLRPGRIGDYLCATPAVRALRRAVPDAEVSYVALPLVQDLVRRNPHVDRFIAFPGFPFIAEQFFDPRRAVRWLAAMQAERYDLVVQLYGSGAYANPIALLMGGRCCAGFIRPEDTGHPLDAAIPLPLRGPEVDRALDLVRHLGVRPAGRAYDLELTRRDRADAGHRIAGLPRPVVGLHCGARDDERRVDARGYARVAAAISGACGASVVILGGEEERAGAARLAGEVGGVTACRNLAGTLPLAAAAAVIAAVDLLVTTDSGPAHLAYATGTPSVTIFTASDPDRWGPPVPGPHALLDCRTGGPPTPRAILDVAAAAGVLPRPAPT